MNVTLLVILIVVAVAGLIALLVIALQRIAAKRRAALQAVAQQAGWTFNSDTVKPETLGMGSFPLFTHGRAQKASNVMRLSGGAVTIFDYEYTVGAGNHQSTVSQTAAHVRSPRLSLPPFALSPENMLHKIGTALGYHDIDFDASPDFSKKYLLRSKEAEERVRDLFTPSVRAYFEHRPPLTVEGFEHEVLVYKQGRQVKPEDLQTFVEDARAIARELGA